MIGFFSITPIRDSIRAPRGGEAGSITNEVSYRIFFVEKVALYPPGVQTKNFPPCEEFFCFGGWLGILTGSLIFE
jgi:hypothetical protein